MTDREIIEVVGRDVKIINYYDPAFRIRIEKVEIKNDIVYIYIFHRLML